MARARNYRAPRMVVRQRFVNDGGASAVAAAVHISGPHANFVSRDSDSFEQGFLGNYSHETGINTWLPDVLQNNVLDRESAEVVFKNAALQYFETTKEKFVLPASSKNIIESKDTDFSFRAHGAFSRADVFCDRDVRAGDLVRLTATVGGETKTFWTSVARLAPRYQPGKILSETEPSATNAPKSDLPTFKILEPTVAGVTADVVSAIGWSDDLLAKGAAKATYTVQVVFGGEAEKAMFRITASNGDSVSSRGLTWDSSDSIYWLQLGSLPGVTMTFEPENTGDILAFTSGMSWVVEATAEYTPAELMAGGSYTASAAERAPKETTYIVTVTKGGLVPDTAPITDKERQACPIISVTTNTGLDRAPLVRVEQMGTPISIGRYGVQITIPDSLDGRYLIEGDKFYVTAQSSYSDMVPYLILTDNVPKDWTNEEEARDSLTGALPVNLDLFIPRETLVVPSSLLTESGVVDNWSIDDRTARIRPNLKVNDPSWTRYGEIEALPVIPRGGGQTKAYLTFRYFVSDLVGTITQVSSAAELDEIVSGPTDPSNPLKYAAFNALAGGDGSQVLLTAVADPSDLAEWEHVCDLISERDDVFHVFPLCYGDKKVQDLFYRHIQSMNKDEVAKERVLYLLDYTKEKMVLVQGTEEVPYEGSMSIEADVSGLEYVAFTSQTAEVNFMELGVRRGDIIRTNFDFDLSGNPVASSYYIAEVINASTMRLEGNPSEYTLDPAASVFEVWRNLTTAEQREVIAETAGIQDMLVRYILIDNVDKSIDPIGPASTFVGLIGAVVPHQGVSWYPLSGWSADGWQGKFSNSDLNHMAGNGVLIITRHADGFVAARHSVTTAKAPLAGQSETALSLKMSEEMFIRNALLLKKEFRNALRGFVGVTNLVPGTIAAIEANLTATANYLKTDNEYPSLGGRITSDLQDVNIRQHIFHRDTLVVSFKVECPFALNALDCTIFV